jgi:hypothetical protein
LTVFVIILTRICKDLENTIKSIKKTIYTKKLTLKGGDGRFLLSLETVALTQALQ